MEDANTLKTSRKMVPKPTMTEAAVDKDSQPMELRQSKHNVLSVM